MTPQGSIGSKPVDPFLAGLLCRCPACGRAPLFIGLIRIPDQCAACATDFRSADTGDGPAVFVMLIVGFIIVPLTLITQIVFHPPMWVHMLIWLPVTAALCLAVMRPFKAILFAMQWKHKAAEARLEP